MWVHLRKTLVHMVAAFPVLMPSSFTIGPNSVTKVWVTLTMTRGGVSSLSLALLSINWKLEKSTSMENPSGPPS